MLYVKNRNYVLFFTHCSNVKHTKTSTCGLWFIPVLQKHILPFQLQECFVVNRLATFCLLYNWLHHDIAVFFRAVLNTIFWAQVMDLSNRDSVNIHYIALKNGTRLLQYNHADLNTHQTARVTTESLLIILWKMGQKDLREVFFEKNKLYISWVSPSPLSELQNWEKSVKLLQLPTLLIVI